MDWQQAVAAIRADRDQGAAELARRALALVEQACHAGSERDLITLIDGLAAARPSMAPLRNAMQAVLDALDEDPFQIREAVAGIARQMTRDGESVQRHLQHCFANGQTVLTVSLSSTVRAALLAAAEKDLRVLVAESRPLYEGVVLARALLDAGISADVLTEAQLGLACREADMLVLGADTVLADGTAFNKVGSYLAALAAREADIPCYVAADRWKWLSPDSPPPEPECMDAAELGHALPAGHLRNVYFEPVPAGLIRGWITEKGFALTSPGSDGD